MLILQTCLCHDSSVFVLSVSPCPASLASCFLLPNHPCSKHAHQHSTFFPSNYSDKWYLSCLTCSSTATEAVPCIVHVTTMLHWTFWLSHSENFMSFKCWLPSHRSHGREHVKTMIVPSTDEFAMCHNFTLFIYSFKVAILSDRAAVNRLASEKFHILNVEVHCLAKEALMYLKDRHKNTVLIIEVISFHSCTLVKCLNSCFLSRCYFEVLAQCRSVFSALVLQNMWFLIDYISRTFPVPRFSQPASGGSSAHALNAQVRVGERMGASVSLKCSLNIECASAARKTDETTKWLPPSSADMLGRRSALHLSRSA